VKKQSKTDKIRNMLHNGEDAATIAKRLKVSKSYVYAVKGRMKKAKKPKRAVTLRDVVAAAHAEGHGVEVGIVPNSALDVQVGGEHYKALAIQPIQYIVANNLSFLEGCIIKRITRWRTKGGVEDLQKIKHEVDLLIELAV
jgi:hypothetical protein